MTYKTGHSFALPFGVGGVFVNVVSNFALFSARHFPQGAQKSTGFAHTRTLNTWLFAPQRPVVHN